MSQDYDRDQLLELFLEFSGFEHKVVCPYCGDDSEIEPTKLCCGEVHSGWYWVNDSETLDEVDFIKAFKRWVADSSDEYIDLKRDAELNYGEDYPNED
jgi:hypothetical protein